MVAAVRAPLEASVSVNGVSLTYFEWGRGSDGDPLLLVHATGFHARCWDQVVAHLGSRRVIAIDQRGHGRSDKVEAIRWQEFGRDVAELVRRLDLQDVVGVGHSAGGHAMVEAAVLEPTRFRRLVLIDPTILAIEDAMNEGVYDRPVQIIVADARGLPRENYKKVRVEVQYSGTTGFVWFDKFVLVQN